METINYTDIFDFAIKSKEKNWKNNIIWYGIDWISYNTENLYTEAKEIESIFKSKIKNISYNIKKQAWQQLSDLKKEWIEININIDSIQNKLEKIFMSDYKSWVIDVNEIYNKIEKAYDLAFSWIVETYIKEEIKKIFIKEGSTIYFIKQLYNITKTNTRYIREVEETSKLFRFYLSYIYQKKEIKLIGWEIYKKQQKYTWSINMYWMTFRLAQQKIINDIKPLLIDFISTKWTHNIQRLDLYIDYIWNLILSKTPKWKQSINVNYYKSKNKDTNIEAETIQYTIADNIKIRNYNTVEDKKNKNKINVYPEYKNKKTKRLEIELKFWRSTIYKIRKSKLWKILTSIKNWDLQQQLAFEYLFLSLFWYKIQDIEEFWNNKELVIQLQELFYYTQIEEIEKKELTQEINISIQQMLKTVKWWNKKLLENWLTNEQIEKYTIHEAQIEKDIEIRLKEKSFSMSYTKTIEEIQSKKYNTDKELFYIENYREEFLKYYKKRIEEIENNDTICFTFYINDYKKNKIHELIQEIKDKKIRNKIIYELENILADLLTIYHKKEEDNKRKLSFLDYIKDEQKQIIYVQKVL